MDEQDHAEETGPTPSHRMPATHPLRARLGRALHDRPFVPLGTPCQVTYLAWVEPASEANKSRAWISALCRQSGVDEPRDDSSFHLVNFESFSLRWERHTEFSSAAFIHTGKTAEPTRDLAHRFVPAAWLADVPGDVLAAIHIAVDPNTTSPPDGALYGDSCCSSVVGGGHGQVWTDFRHHADGFSRFYVSDNGMQAETTGRLVQRLIEIELYQSLALHGFERAWRLTPRLLALEERLAELTEFMCKTDGASVLTELLSMSAEVERIAAETSFRFSATAAYAQIVSERCEALKEQEIPGKQTLGEFMERRFQPAVRTVAAMERRREMLSGHLGRAVSLLHIQVGTAVETQNRTQISAMADRAKRSLMLQETVEGLSVIAISYYAVSLLGFLFRFANSMGLTWSPTAMQAVSVPFVLLITWLAMKRIHARILAD